MAPETRMPMDAFIDPRAHPVPETVGPPTRTTAEPAELRELHQLCREDRLYDVERWIQAGRPLQLAGCTSPRGRRPTSALEIVLRNGNYALALLLLSNGYDPNLEYRSPVDIALRTRRFDLVDVLLKWGADPNRVDLYDLFGTYRSSLFERFRTFGVDLTKGHALAETLAYHTSNKPLFGFAKRHRTENPRFQTELNIALAHHAEEGNERGVQLCLWTGADPHVPVPSLRYEMRPYEDEDADDEDRFVGFSAIHAACSQGDVRILELLGPDPARDDLDELYRVAKSGAIVDHLARLTLPRDVGAVIQYHIWWSSFDRGFSSWRSLDPLERLFKAGARWQTSSAYEIPRLRQCLLKTFNRTFVDLMKLLATADYCAPEILYELARTPAMRRKMKDVGFIPPSEDDSNRQRRDRPTRSREVLKKFGVELPDETERAKSPQVPQVIQIGPWRPNGREIRLSREALFERLWTDPVATVAKEWGLSGRGLSKACQRAHIPLPPRGYWAKVRVGRRVRRPRLPKLPAGEAEEIVISAPE